MWPVPKTNKNDFVVFYNYAINTITRGTATNKSNEEHHATEQHLINNYGSIPCRNILFFNCFKNLTMQI